MSIDYLSIDILNFRHRLNICACMIYERQSHNKNFKFNKYKIRHLIVLKKNPINDINVFNNNDKNLMLIIKDGEIIKNSFS